jgi:hypothetical protein
MSALTNIFTSTYINTLPEEKRLFGRPRHKWKKTIMNPLEVGWEAVDWNHLDRDRWWAFANTVTNLQVT